MSIRVALVDDDQALRTIFVDWLKSEAGIEVVGDWPNAEAACQDMPSTKPDVALMDINMPGADGITCIQHLHPRLPGTLFIVLTVYEDSDRIFNALAAGACGYLLKQTTRHALIDAIRNAVDGGSPMSDSIARKVVSSFHLKPAPESPEIELSPRESEILSMLASGDLYKEIAATLEIAEATVNSYIRRIYKKLQVHSRAQAVAEYYKIDSAESKRHP